MNDDGQGGESQGQPIKMDEDDYYFNVFLKDQWIMEIHLGLLGNLLEVVKKGIKVHRTSVKDMWAADIRWNPVDLGWAEDGNDKTFEKVNLGTHFTNHPRQLLQDLVLSLSLKPVKWGEKIELSSKRPFKPRGKPKS